MNWLPAALFLPWFAILGTLSWLFPRQPRTPARRAYDIGALLVSALAFALALRWAHAHADTAYGRLWPQIFATSVGYGAFLAVLAFASCCVRGANEADVEAPSLLGRFVGMTPRKSVL